MIALLKLIPLRDWLWAVLVAALAAALIAGAIHERRAGAAAEHAARTNETAARASVAATWAASAASEVQRRETAQKESDHEADRFTALADAGAARAVSAGDRLQQRFDAPAAGACRLPGDPTALSASAPASAAGDLRSDVLRRVREVAGQFASVADKRGAAGADAERQYDSLTPPAAASAASTPSAR